MLKGTRRRILQVTQRLDHMVPDPESPTALNAEAARRLEELSRRLARLLPDPSLSPDERLERIARVVQDRVPMREHLLPAIEKLHRLERRLEELAPGGDLNSLDRLERLVDAVHGMAPENFAFVDDGSSFVRLLEQLGDKRAGFQPIPNGPE